MDISWRPKIWCCLLALLVGAGCDRAESLLQRGNMAYNQGHKTSAVEYYQQAREHDSTRAAASYNLGRLRFEDGQYAEAKELFDEALPLELKNPIIRVYRARAAWELDQQELAEKDLRLTVRLHPRLPEGHFFLAQLLASRGEFEEAIQEMRQAGRAPHLLEQATLLMAEWHRENGEPRAAASLLEGLLSTHGFRYQTYLELGKSLLEAGELRQAETFLRKGLALNPGDPEGLLTLGVVFEGQSKPELARELYQALIDKGEDDWAERARKRLDSL